MYTTEQLTDSLASQCSGLYTLAVKRPGIFQVTVPVYHEDRDLVEIYLEEGPNGKVRITDYGMALMRLSYDYDIDSPNKEQILAKIIAESRLLDEDGKIYIDVELDELYPGILQLAGGITKISSMRFFRKEVIQNLFYESVENFIVERLASYNPEKNHIPIASISDLEVDYVIRTKVRPLFIYPVKGADKAKNVMINCLMLQKENVPFTSVIVHENFDGLPKKDKARLTNIVDKQFSSFEGFTDHMEGFILRESMTAQM